MNSREETTFWEGNDVHEQRNRATRLFEILKCNGKRAVVYCTLAIILQIQGDFPSDVIVTSFYGGGDQLTPPWRPPKYISP